MGKKDNLLQIDYRASGATNTVFLSGNSGSGSVNTSLFVLRDGTQGMLANLDMGGFSVTNVNLLDGVDLSSFYSSYTAHIININAHHNQVHEIISSDHTASGLTTGQVIRASGSSSFAFAQLQHDDLGGVTANQHHNQVHEIIGSDHTVAGSTFGIIGLTSTNTLGILTPTHDVSAPIERILKSNSSGGLQLASLTTPLINTASGDITLNPAGNIILDSNGTGTLPGGTIVEDLGYYNRKWRTLYAAELYVETLVAQNVMATIGGRIIVAPTTTLIADATNVATTIDVKHNFLTTNDYIILQTAPGGIAQTEVMRIISTPTAVAGGYRYSVTRNLDGSGANSWLSGDAVVELGQGYIDLTSTSTVLNSKIGPTITIYDRNSTSTWNALTPTVSMGNLNGFVGYSTDTNGFATGNNLTLGATTGFIGATIDRTNGLRLFNTPFSMYNGATERVHIGGHNDIWIGPSSADKRLIWDGATLTISGTINVTGGNAATLENISGNFNLVRNSSFELDSNGDGLADYFVVYNNDGGAVPTTASRVVGLRSRWAQRISWTGTNTSTKGIYFDSIVTKSSGKYYVLSFWARCSQATTLNLYENNPQATTKTWITSNSISTGWQFYAMRLQWSSTPAANFYISIPAAPAISNGWIDFDNIMLSESEEVMPYVISQDDIISNGGAINMPFLAGSTGLYLTSTYLGYWDSGTASWRTFLDNQGRFYFRGASGARLVWDGTRLFGGTSESFNVTTAQWYVDSTNGRLVAGQGQIAITANGMNLSYYGTYNSVNYGSYSRFRWYYTGATESGLLAQMYLQTSWDYVYATTVPFENRVKELLLISNDSNFIGFTIRNNSGSSIFSVTGNRIYSNQPLYLFGTSTNALTGGLEVGGTIGYAWNTPTLSGGWVNSGSPNTAVQYKRFGNLVSIKGVVIANTTIAANSIMFTLASGYRPDATRSFICYCRTPGGTTKNFTRVYINNAGGVYSDEAFVTNDWICLEITFIT